jgi:dipeptidyl aminopeptidase/acylaminoacyl peptidase
MFRPSLSSAFRAGSLVLLIVACLAAVAAADTAPADSVAVTRVGRALQLGPLPLPLPAFHDADKAGVDLGALADEPGLDVAGLWPRAGERVPAAAGDDPAWAAGSAPFAGAAPDSDRATEQWLAFYVRTDRWRKATLVTPLPDGVLARAWLDGASVPLTAGGDAEDGVTDHRADLDLEIGVRLVVLRLVAGPDAPREWSLAPRLETTPAPAVGLAVTDRSRRLTDIHLVLDAPRCSDAVISPDGSLTALRLSEYDPSGRRRSWVEIRRTDGGGAVTTWRGLDAGNLQWAPDGARLSYTTGGEKGVDLWLHDLRSGETSALLRGVADMGGYRWSPDGAFLVYEVRTEAKPDERKVKRVENPADRQGWWRHRTHLVMAAVPSGVTRRLTAGPLSPGSWSIAPDSDRLLFFLEDQDLAGGRPYFSSELWELDLTTLAATPVLADRWIGAASYGPDPGTLLLQGSPSAFDGLGRNLPEGVTANDYGGQLYVFDRGTGAATPFSRDLTPDVARSWWSLDDGMIYALCTDTQFRNVYRRHPDKGGWERVDTGVEYTDQFDLARSGRMAVARGSGAASPNTVHAVDLKRGRARQLLDPGHDAWRDVAFGEVEHWPAPLPDGEILDGRIYWPVDYDPARTYPVIVYYYGGTSPVTVDFGGRYPKNVWAAQGYIVYVPEPSGATGYGQEFAARHVNDWGERTAWEVIEATRAFLAAHPSADGDNVGCIGASYGGFLTMNIITKTDLFAAAVSHAGISSISSYWGEGLWGYAYGARALAGAFPWADRDVYVEQSPLFFADRITTPLLLVHGDSDTNVPVGESDQLFTALKLLGREVEYVQIQGQDHHILDHEQRVVWNDTILAYFARYLKERPDWWNALYPDK